MKIKLLLILIFIFSSVLHSEEQATQTQKKTTSIVQAVNNKSEPKIGIEEFSSPIREVINLEAYPKVLITIKNEKPISCDLDSISKIYICLNKGTPILVKYNSFGFSAITKDSNNSITAPMVSHVETVDKVIYDTPSFYLDSLASQLVGINKYNLIDQFFSQYELGVKKELDKSSKDFQAIFDSYFEEKIKIKNDLNESKYIVELEDGQKINCTREAKRKKINCGAFQCDSLKIDEKDYDVTMLYDSDPDGWGRHSIHLIDSNGLGPSVNIKKISTSRSSNLLVDNSNILKMKGMYTSSVLSIPIFSSSMNQENDKFNAYKKQDFQKALDTSGTLCKDDNNSLKLLNEAKNKFFEKVANLELVEFIQILADGLLTSSYIDPSQALKLGCLYQGVYLNEEAVKNLDKLKKNIHPDSQVGQTISMDRAIELFDSAVKMDDIAWKYKQDGCYARAHLMARRFEAEGVRVDKVWLKGDLYVPESDPKIEWKFHVAPIIYVRDENGNVKKMVIDPSLFSKPVTVEEWDQKISKKTLRGSVITVFPYPENAAMVERSALAFSSSDPYMPNDRIDMSEEDKMNHSKKIMKDYKPMEPII